MRAVNKNFNRIPIGLQTNNLNEVIDTTVANHRDKIKDSIYRETTVLTKLFALYNYKCAYCESYEPEPEVEHYRPKKGVTGEPGNIGYYWLCYEWSNLLPACHDCNKKRSKGNHFPIEGARKTEPTIILGAMNLNDNRLNSNALLANEVPLLLNPECPGYNPFDYFLIDSNGKIYPRPNVNTLEYRQAFTTISKMRLNRDKLALNVRKRHIKYYMNRVKVLLYKFLNGRINTLQLEDFFSEIIIELNQRTLPAKTNEHWFFWEYFLLNFKSFLNSFFKPRFRNGLFRLYDSSFAAIRP